MLTLYYLPGSAAMAAQAALEEAGADYEPSLVVRDGDLTVVPADYLRLNPHGRVPTLLDGDLVMFESAAVVLHVADRFPASGLVPPVGDPDRSLAYRSLTYLTNTVQATSMHWF